MQYGPLWRVFRKLVHQNFMESVVEKDYVPVQNAEAVQMLFDFCQRPDQHMLHPKRFSNSVAMSISKSDIECTLNLWQAADVLVFGMRTPSLDTPHMTRLYNIMDDWVQLMEPGATPPVDIFPIFHWLPQRLYNNWTKTSKRIGSNMDSLYSSLLSHVRTRRTNPTYPRTTVMDSVLDQSEKLGLTDHQIYFLCGVLNEGASDTTATAIQSFIHAMSKWPDILRKAQSEVDSIVGEDRTPVWEDYARLPYVAMTVKEAMRWRPVLPLAFPHAVTEDDWVGGYLIPKGSTVIVNVWGLHRDAAYFSNPDVFDPDHFKGKTAIAPQLASVLDVDQRDHYGYGAGRRICPGMHLAERNLFLAIVKLIWAFDIGPGVDEKTGLPVDVDIGPQTGYKEGLVLGARPFACRVSVRSTARKDTIVREFEKASAEIFSKYDF
ncbi:unnamed protein product [Penicillium manginii]